MVSDYVYLGIKFNYNGSFTKAIDKQLSQAKRAIHSLITKSRKLSLPIDIILELFDACILPILLYGSEIWGFANINDIEILHNQFCKQMMRLGKKSTNCMVLGELGRHKLERPLRREC